MGEILSAVASVKQAANAAGFGGGGGGTDYTNAAEPHAQAQLPEMPGPQMSSPDMAQLAPNMNSGGSSGMAEMLTAPQQTAQLQPMQDEEPEVFDNPYARTDQPIEEEITVQGDDWEPKKLDLLGQIGDALLIARGRRPIFRERMKERNARDAMKGFQKDPETAISRMRQVDAEAAQDLQEQQSRVSANEELRAKRALDRKIEGGKIMGSMMDAIKDDETYQRVRPALEKMSSYYEYDPDLLPKTFDREGFDMMVRQGMTPYEGRRLKQFERAQGFEEKHKTRQQDALEKDRNIDNAEQARHNRANEGISQQNADKSSDKRVINYSTKYGPGSSEDGGKTMIVVDESGRKHSYKNMGSKDGQIRWQLFDSEKVKPEE